MNESMVLVASPFFNNKPNVRQPLLPAPSKKRSKTPRCVQILSSTATTFNCHNVMPQAPKGECDATGSAFRAHFEQELQGKASRQFKPRPLNPATLAALQQQLRVKPDICSAFQTSPTFGSAAAFGLFCTGKTMEPTLFLNPALRRVWFLSTDSKATGHETMPLGLRPFWT